MKRRKPGEAAPRSLDVTRVRAGDPATDPRLVDLRHRFSGSDGDRRRWDASATGWDRRSPFNDWLRPASLATFLSRHWNRRALHVPAPAPDRFADYFSLDALGRLIATQAIPPAHLKRFDAAQRPLATPPPGPRGSDALDLMVHMFRGRGSLLLESLESWHEGVHRLWGEFRRWTGHSAAVNAYFTAPNGKTLRWHWDNHDVFVLQIAGEKEWSLYEPLFALPLPTHEIDMWPLFNEDTARLRDRLTLRPGDLLYLPRGVPHQARAGASHSLHLTVGLFGITWHELVRDLVETALQRCEQDLAFRSVVDGGEGPRRGKVDRARLQALVRKVVERVDFGAAEERLRARRLGEPGLDRASLEALWGSFTTAEPLGAGSVCARTSSAFALRPHADYVEVETATHKLIFPATAKASLAQIARRARFTTAELELARRNLGQALELVQSLIENGLVARAEPGP